MNYLVVSQYDWICREKSGLDTKNLKELEKMISSNKEKRKRRRVKKAVAKRQQLENKREKLPTGKIISYLDEKGRRITYKEKK